MNRVQKVNETLTVNKRKYNISWNPNHQLNLLVELVPDMISKANVTKRLRVQILIIPQIQVMHFARNMRSYCATSTLPMSGRI